MLEIAHSLHENSVSWRCCPLEFTLLSIGLTIVTDFPLCSPPLQCSLWFTLLQWQSWEWFISHNSQNTPTSFRISVQPWSMRGIVSKNIDSPTNFMLITTKMGIVLILINQVHDFYPELNSLSARLLMSQWFTFTRYCHNAKLLTTIILCCGLLEKLLDRSLY